VEDDARFMNTYCGSCTFAERGEDRFELRNGGRLGPVTLAYETYGTLNGEGSNAILIFHALTGSQHVAGYRENVPGVEELWNEECRVGWWDSVVGEAKALDTRRFYLICVNYLGGCYGSTGPSSINPETGKPYGNAFPWITIPDVVNSQMRVLEHLGVKQLYAVIGASLGGLMALQLAVLYPDRVRFVVSIASGVAVSPLQRIHNLEKICVIENDPYFNGGNYYEGKKPLQGMLLARIISHKTYVSLKAMEDRARGEIKRDYPMPDQYHLQSPLESYMLHQGYKFIKRFDPNSYLRIIGIWQQFALLGDSGAENYKELFSRCRHQEHLIFSINSDVCFYPEEQDELISALQQGGVTTHKIVVTSDKGHDAFLVEPERFARQLEYWLYRRFEQ